MKYNIDYFIQKFEAIPDDMIISHRLNYEKKHCANGWCGVTSLDKPTEEAAGLYEIFKDVKVTHVYDGKEICDSPSMCYSNKLANINNGETKEYQQSTPKQRILAALRDVKKQQEKQAPVRERITYVVIPESVSKELKEQVEETVLS